MTQQELRQTVFNLTKKILDKKAYIKGYGNLFRVMDELHNPLQNITTQVMNVLKLNKVVIKSGLVYVIDESFKGFTHPIDVQLPKNNE